MVRTTTPYTTCAVDRPMNDHGALTLSEVTGNRTYPVVEYASTEVRKMLTTADCRTVVRVWLEPLSSRGEAWKAVDVKNNVDATCDGGVTLPAKL